jgi:peptide/nickel transport system ATP-binding protein
VPAPEDRAAGPLLEIDGLSRSFGRRGPFAPPPLRAADGVSFAMAKAETLALVGESGSGKSTLARILIGLDMADAGTARFEAFDLAALPASDRPEALIRRVQMVFQNPDGTLNPAHRIGFILARALRRAGKPHGAEDVAALLASVNLPAGIAERHPADLSGGQRQRVAIARAFAGDLSLLVADEPVSALDVSVQAAIIGLLSEMRARHGTAILLISHDLMLVRHVADRVVVLYRGRVMERGPASAVFAAPFHPYTDALMASVHPPDPDHVPRVLAAPDDPGPPPGTGCPFHNRCHRRMAHCADTPPPLRDAGGGHAILCHHPIAHLTDVAEPERTA